MQSQRYARDQEYSTHVLRHLTSADPVPRNFDYWPPMSKLRRLVRHTGTYLQRRFPSCQTSCYCKGTRAERPVNPDALATFRIVGKNEAACAAEVIARIRPPGITYGLPVIRSRSASAAQLLSTDVVPGCGWSCKPRFDRAFASSRYYNRYSVRQGTPD